MVHNFSSSSRFDELLFSSLPCSGLCLSDGLWGAGGVHSNWPEVADDNLKFTNGDESAGNCCCCYCVGDLNGNDDRGFNGVEIADFVSVAGLLSI